MPQSPTERSTDNNAPAPKEGALFDLLLSGDRRPAAVCTAVREIEALAGQSVVRELKAEIRAAVQELRTEIATTNTRLDSVQRQLTLIWTFLVLLLGTFLGTLTTVLLRG